MTPVISASSYFSARLKAKSPKKKSQDDVDGDDVDGEFPCFFIFIFFSAFLIYFFQFFLDIWYFFGF